MTCLILRYSQMYMKQDNKQSMIMKARSQQIIVFLLHFALQSKLFSEKTDIDLSLKISIDIQFVQNILVLNFYVRDQIYPSQIIMATIQGDLRCCVKASSLLLSNCFMSVKTVGGRPNITQPPQTLVLTQHHFTRTLLGIGKTTLKIYPKNI